jgi:hypothetical protein
MRRSKSTWQPSLYAQQPRYWWLPCQGCLTEDVNCLIQHCFIVSQQQKVTKSKYVKDAGYTVIDQTDAVDIINAATTQGIYDLTLGISDKERGTLVAGRVHKASAITFGEAKEGLLEAHNFSSKALITLTLSKNKKTQDTTLVATAKSLAKLVFSIRTTTLKVTKEEMEESNEEDTSNEEKVKRNEKRVAIEGMGILNRNNSKEMPSKTGEEDKEKVSLKNPRKTSSKDQMTRSNCSNGGSVS